MLIGIDTRYAVAAFSTANNDTHTHTEKKTFDSISVIGPLRIGDIQSFLNNFHRLFVAPGSSPKSHRVSVHVHIGSHRIVLYSSTTNHPRFYAIAAKIAIVLYFSHRDSVVIRVVPAIRVRAHDQFPLVFLVIHVHQHVFMSPGRYFHRLDPFHRLNVVSVSVAFLS